MLTKTCALFHFQHFRLIKLFFFQSKNTNINLLKCERHKRPCYCNGLHRAFILCNHFWLSTGIFSAKVVLQKSMTKARLESHTIQIAEKGSSRPPLKAQNEQSV